MSAPQVIILVRFKSAMPFEELMKVAESRYDAFRALSGLKQKYYVHDPETGEFGGLYLWDSQEKLDDYLTSELRAGIAAAYQTIGAPRVDRLEVLSQIRETVGA